jgi:hypothetical protein
MGWRTWCVDQGLSFVDCCVLVAFQVSCLLKGVKMKETIDQIVANAEKLGRYRLALDIIKFVSDEVDRAELQGETPNCKHIVERVLEML